MCEDHRNKRVFKNVNRVFGEPPTDSMWLYMHVILTNCLPAIAIDREFNVKHLHRRCFICVHTMSAIYRISPGPGNKISMVIKHDFLGSFQDILAFAFWAVRAWGWDTSRRTFGWPHHPGLVQIKFSLFYKDEISSHSTTDVAPFWHCSLSLSFVIQLYSFVTS
jgi:hypothetical protein